MIRINSSSTYIVFSLFLHSSLSMATEKAHTANNKFDHSIGICKLIDNRPEMKLTAYNVFNPIRSVRIYFIRHEGKNIQLDGNAYLSKKPKFGTIEGDPSRSVSYVLTKDGYVGKDYAELIYEKNIKIKYTFHVMNRVPGGSHEYDPYQDKNLCPNGKYWNE